MDNVETFDTLAGALNRIDVLRASKQVAYLGHEVIEATFDKLGRWEDVLCLWLVRRGPVKHLEAINPVTPSRVAVNSETSTNPVRLTTIGTTIGKGINLS